MQACNLSPGEAESGAELVVSKAQGKWILEMTLNLYLKAPRPREYSHNYKECIYSAPKGETEEPGRHGFHRSTKVLGWSEVLFARLVDLGSVSDQTNGHVSCHPPSA